MLNTVSAPASLTLKRTAHGVGNADRHKQQYTHSVTRMHTHTTHLGEQRLQLTLQSTLHSMKNADRHKKRHTHIVTRMHTHNTLASSVCSSRCRARFTAWKCSQTQIATHTHSQIKSHACMHTHNTPWQAASAARAVGRASQGEHQRQGQSRSGPSTPKQSPLVANACAAQPGV